MLKVGDEVIIFYGSVFKRGVISCVEPIRDSVFYYIKNSAFAFYENEVILYSDATWSIM